MVLFVLLRLLACCFAFFLIIVPSFSSTVIYSYTPHHFFTLAISLSQGLRLSPMSSSSCPPLGVLPHQGPEEYPFEPHSPLVCVLLLRNSNPTILKIANFTCLYSEEQGQITADMQSTQKKHYAQKFRTTHDTTNLLR